MSGERTLRGAADFVDAALIGAGEAASAEAVIARYSAALPADLADLVVRNDRNDAIGRQFVPDARELVSLPGELADPIGDEVHAPLPGLVHRYADRVLLKIVAACPVYCRFCFRRESVGDGKGGLLPNADLSAALDYIRADDRIWEVILTGGDPLAVSPRRLASVLEAIGAIPHVGAVRFHTRVPLLTPQRIDEHVVRALRSAGKAVFVALHANHPREFTDGGRAACARLVEAGIPLLSQSVLLAGINDDTEVLVALMRCFVAARITPYYLHHPDLAPGTGHFRVPVARGRELVAQLSDRLPGFARPRYVLDLPGGHGKVRLDGDGVQALGPGEWLLRDRFGQEHRYVDCLPEKRTGS